MARDRPKHPAQEIFSAKRKIQQSKPDSLGSRRPAQVSVKYGYPPPKSGYFTAIISCSVNMVADRYKYAAYHNKYW